MSILSWAVSLALLVLAVSYYAWCETSDSLAAREAALHPATVIGSILAQLSNAAPIADWNIPVKSLAVYLLWLTGTPGIGMLAMHFIARGRVTDFFPQIPARWVVAFATGFTLIALLQFALGITGLLAVPLIPILIATTAASLALSPIRQQWRQLLSATRWHWLRLPRIGRAGVIILAIAIVILAIPALLPPTQSDGVRYHLGAVQEYLKAGKIGYIPSNAYSNMPFLVEMHFLAALACQTEEATQLMHFTLALFTCAAIYALSRTLYPTARRFTAFAPALLYLFTPMSAILATWPFTDHGIAFFLIVSVLLAIAFAQRGCRSMALLLGLALGGLIGTKYTMGPVAALILIAPLFIARAHRQAAFSDRQECLCYGAGSRGLIVPLALATAVTAIVGGVWYVKNFLLTGNPFYPLASGLFPGGEWATESNRFLMDRVVNKGMGTSLTDFLLAPWNATFHWVRFEAHNPGMIIIASVICLVAAGLHLPSAPNRRAIIATLTITAATIIIWFFSYQSNRLLLPTIALALALMPAGLFHHTIHMPTLAPRAPLIRGTIACGLLALYGFSWAVQWSYVATALTPPPLPYLLGRQYKVSYLDQSLTYSQAFQHLNKTVPPNEKVLLIGEHRIYGAQFHALWSDWFDTPILAQILRKHNLDTTEDLLSWLRSERVFWIAINERELLPQLEHDFKPRFSPDEWQIFESLRTLDAPGATRQTIPPGMTIIHLDTTP